MAMIDFRITGRVPRPVVRTNDWSIIAMAHDLGMDVVAEGVETDSDAVEMYQLGCEYAQGFAFGEPMDADAAMRMLTEEQRLEAASVASLVGQHAGIDADLAQGLQIFGIDVATEDQILIGSAMQPAIVLDLGLELAGRPARIAQRQNGMLGSAAVFAISYLANPSSRPHGYER
eukprot:gene44615-60424_t